MRNPWTYDLPIQSDEHANWCRKEAERRYGGNIVRDSVGMLVVRQPNGITHTDAVLRALSFL
jgi:hypothetical protein